MGLVHYRRKRHFDRSPEPQGGRPGAGALRFVVQKHDASRLHYDFRLELDGVLKSWAVPKGPSLNPQDKRLAVLVEDHPLDYRTFEGTIPAGNYGAGTVMVWDEGTFRCGADADWRASARALRDGLARGRVSFVVEGHKLRGEFSLVRLARGKDNEWLLLKKRDEWAGQQDVTASDRSVTTGRRLDEITRGLKGRRRPTYAGSAGAKNGHRERRAKRRPDKALPPGKVRPMLATLVREPFDRPGWLFEVKWDGYRAIAEVGRRGVALYSRNHHSFASRFRPLVDALARLGHDAVLDGEVVAVDERGRGRFQLLQNYQKTGRGDLRYYAFDLLKLDGRDLRGLPLRERKARLAGLLDGLPGVFVSEHVEGRGVAFFEAARQQGLEGVVAKDGDSPYREGVRGAEWLKVKTHGRQEAVIGGFTEPRGSRKGLGALLLGVYDGKKLVYIGHTGGGLTAAGLGDLRARLDPLVRKKCPFATTPKPNAPVHWVKPSLVCEVSFQEWTDEGILRQPIFQGLREDKAARAVRREVAVSPAAVSSGTATSGRRPPSRVLVREPARGGRKSPVGVPVTHPDKVYWPEEGYTKGELIAYYREVAPVILPYLRDRPESLHRHPNGAAGKSFFQKDVSRQPPPAPVQTVSVPGASGGGTVRYALCQDEASLVYLANLGCIELNPWHSRVASFDRPDYLVIDLDPRDVPFDRVVEAAVAVRKTLDRAGAECLCKTSGKRGLHVVVPLGARYDYEQAKQFAELIALRVHGELPGTTSLVRSPAQRRRRVYLDFLQNRRGQTLAAPYCARPYPGATVSTPLAWREVKKGLDPSAFTIKRLARRLEKVGDLWAPVLGEGVDLAECLERLSGP